MKTMLCEQENKKIKNNGKGVVRHMANILNKKDFQYLVFGKIICRYPKLVDKKGYSLVGDIASPNGWKNNALSMKLKMDEINDFEFYSLDELKQYCAANKVNIKF